MCQGHPRDNGIYSIIRKSVMTYIPKTIFRGNDIRGKENEDLNEGLLQLLGLAYGTFLRENNTKRVIVGYDSRASSESYANAIVSGLKQAGMSVVRIGLVLTPMVSWALHRFKIDGGVMITASHNPVGWNGVKFFYTNHYDSSMLLDRLYDMVTNDTYKKQDGGDERTEDIEDAYFQDIIGRVNITRKMSIFVNTGNGTAGRFVPRLLKMAGCDVVEWNTDINPLYPHYTPDPLNEEMIQDTAQAMLIEECDYALMFDGDGDRVGLLDENGSLVHPDIFLLCLIRALQQEKKRVVAVCDVMSTQALDDECEREGVTITRVPTGYSSVREAMTREKADIAGELSGHIFFNHNYYGFDDGLYAALKLSEYFAHHHEPVSRIIQSIPQYISSRPIYIPVPDGAKMGIVEDIKSFFQKGGYSIDCTDGVRVNLPYAWVIIRASQTSPSLGIRFEAQTREGFLEIENLIRTTLSRYEEVDVEW